MSTVKSKKLQVGTDASASNNFTIYQPSTPDGTLRIGVGNADSPTEIARFNSTGMISGAPTPSALSTATGSAPSYSARAWVNFDGTGTVAIRESGNVSSITDHATGEYSINFTTAFLDNEYSGVYSCRNLSGNFHSVSEDGNTVVRSTTAVRIVVGKHDNSVASDTAVVSAAFFR